MSDPVTAASGADQPTLRDQLANEIRSRWVLRGDAGAGKIADALMPLIEADRERAKAEAAAEALHRAADWIVKTDFDRQHPDLFRAIADVLHAQARWSRT